MFFQYNFSYHNIDILIYYHLHSLTCESKGNQETTRGSNNERMQSSQDVVSGFISPSAVLQLQKGFIVHFK